MTRFARSVGGLHGFLRRRHSGGMHGGSRPALGFRHCRAEWLEQRALLSIGGPRFFPQSEFPPPNGMYVADHDREQTLQFGSGENAILIKNFCGRMPSGSIAPPAPGAPAVTHAFGSQVEMDVSTDGGGSWQPVVATANSAMQMQYQAMAGGDDVYGTQMVQLDVSGGGVMIRESPTRASSGQTTVKPVPGGYMVSSFFDIFIEVSTDGTTWEEAQEAMHVELRVDPTTVAPVPAPQPLYPPPVSEFTAAGAPLWQQYGSQIVVKEPRLALYSQSITPPPLGASVTHTFDLQLDFQLSTDGGMSWVSGRTLGQIRVAVEHTRDFAGRETYETELLQLDVSGPDLPAGVMIRESPTKASLGGMSMTTDGGGWTISSFFDIFTEVSTDGGGSWQASRGCTYMVPHVLEPVASMPTSDLPPETGQYVSTGGLDGAFANGMFVRHMRLKDFSQSFAPPPLGVTDIHTFDGTECIDTCDDVVGDFDAYVESAVITMQITGSQDSGGTRYFDTEMLQLDVTLPSGVMIRESPTKHSLGRTSLTAGGADNDCDSFFDIFIEVSTDGGQNWYPNTLGPVTLVLMPHSALNDPPVANAGGPYVANLGEGVVLDGSGSYDANAPCDAIVQYEWDFDYDGAYEASSDSPVLIEPPTQTDLLGVGTHSIGLRVTDSQGASDTATTTLSIYDNRPIARFTVGPTSMAPGHALTLDARGSTHGRPDRRIVEYAWDLDNDGVYDDGEGQIVAHAFASSGRHTVGLRVTDNNVPPKTAVTQEEVTAPAKKWFEKENVLPPANGMYIENPGSPPIVYPNGVAVKNWCFGVKVGSVPPPDSSQVTHAFGSQFEMDVSTDGGHTFVPVTANAALMVQTANLAALEDDVYAEEMLQMNLSGGGVMIRESPTRASSGETRIEAVPGGYMISSFFDIYIEVSTDGIEWEEAAQPMHVEFLVDPTTVPPMGAPTELMPPPGARYQSTEETWQVFPTPVGELHLREVVPSLFSGSVLPPPEGAAATHTFDSQVDFQLSMDGGLTFSTVRAPATMTVAMEHKRDFSGRATYETEVTQLDIAGPELPAGVMIRESPTRASRGVAALMNYPGGGAVVQSFFDIFLEVTTDGGQSWQPATTGPCHLEAQAIDLPEPYPTDNLPPPEGEYCSLGFADCDPPGPGTWIAKNVVLGHFTESFPPPGPGETVTHTFGSQVEMDVSTDGGGTFVHVTAPAQTTVRTTSSQDSGGTRYFDTEMLQLDISGGDLPPGVMIRESPTRASQGRTSLTANGTDNDCDSFFDIFIEVSTDGGQSWYPSLSGPATVTLEPLAPENMDFGDAPDTYRTLLASNGARHVIIANGPRLGSLEDAEPDGQPTAAADGDDLNPPIGFDDEDGVTIPTMFAGGTANITIVVSGAPANGAVVEGWIDFDGNGLWTAGELVVSGVFANGAHTVSVPVPAGSIAGNTYARFRISTAGTGAPVGPADDGEVEDYQVRIEQVKWDQAPDPAHPQNVYYGWNETSWYGERQIAADDWLCSTPGPVTEIVWWGSFKDWDGPGLPNVQPSRFVFSVWTDKPADPHQPGSFSHPDKVIWQREYPFNLVASFEGWDYDPRTQSYEACYKFDQVLPQADWFYQAGGPVANVYWLSIAAVYPDVVVDHPFGWKTRPRDPTSPAPDDAVRISDPVAPVPGSVFASGAPLWWPTRDKSWDLAFELKTTTVTSAVKWEQTPDLSNRGIDVNDTYRPGAANQFLLADDFLCTSTGPITKIDVFGSWKGDGYPGLPADPKNVAFTLSIHADIPAGPVPYSTPGDLLWIKEFQPGSFSVTRVATNLQEGWLDPPSTYTPNADFTCWQYHFEINSTEAFVQQGTSDRPIVYWLDVQAVPQDVMAVTTFGWKTRPATAHFNDDAVWTTGNEQVHDVWRPLKYPLQHPSAGQSIDLAFRLEGEQWTVGDKWVQPPVRYDVPNAFNGWDEASVYNANPAGDPMFPIVADDWLCTTADPVTDIHWWGSFLKWGNPVLPATQLPQAFHIGIWTDVPADPGQVGSFSHPGTMIWENYCTTYSAEFVGWDFDPRYPGKAPEAKFYFSQDLPREEWFHQTAGNNIYWVSISAVYPAGQAVQYPFGWETRPHNFQDDAVRITDPTTPVLNGRYVSGNPIEDLAGNSWDMSFVLTTQHEQLDFGDAPDGFVVGYPTLLMNNGARHVVRGPYLGNVPPDAEPDGQPVPPGLGDDQNPPLGISDEDGVSIPPLVQGVPTPITFLVNAPLNGAVVEGWIDFDGDRDWSDPGELVVNGLYPNGNNVVWVTAPAGSIAGTTYARFRISMAGTGAPWGLAPDGEVEDYAVKIEPQSMDFGDAPDSPLVPGYPTLLINNGARHAVGGPYLGNMRPDTEPDGQPVPPGLGDDVNPPTGISDEDGVHIPALLLGVPVPVTFLVNAPLNGAVVEGWIDFNGDRDWNDPGELVVNGGFPNGNNVVWVTAPAGSIVGTTYARFRISMAGTGAPTGQARDGEVEDYQVTIEGPQWDFGDAPDSDLFVGYPTWLHHDGARHVITSAGPWLGNVAPDAEADGQSDPAALGDDNNGVDDEDGVHFPPLVVGQQNYVFFEVSSSGDTPAYVDGWIDFNGNRQWEAGEQFVSGWFGPGQYWWPVTPPATSLLGQTFARVRTNSRGPLAPTGPALDGEVEDHAVQLVALPENAKWVQLPDTSFNGIDIRVDQGRTVADDFLCKELSLLTDVHLFGSWKQDVKGQIRNIHLSVHSDDPVGPGGSDPQNLYSTPDQLLWSHDFQPGQFTEALYTQLPRPGEWWWDPAPNGELIRGGDTQLWKIDVPIKPEEAFLQRGTPEDPVVYWLDVRVQTDGGEFGWKTRQWPDHFMDDAVWAWPEMPPFWNELRYPPGHPYSPSQRDSIDMAFVLTFAPAPLDFGDALDSDLIVGYPTWLRHDGARHVITSTGPWLGNVAPDAEADGQSDPGALGDDNNGVDDEDGVDIPPLVQGTPVNVTFTVSGEPTGGAMVEGWIDFNGNKSWGDTAAELVVSGRYGDGTYTAAVTAPIGSIIGTTSARFRISTQGTGAPTGLAADGEVEDYTLVIAEPWDFGDAPDSYPTKLPDGPRHKISRDLYLGTRQSMPDAEPDGQPTPAADGDDLWDLPTAWDDEDGVTFLNTLVPGGVAYVDVQAVGLGLLHAWVDFNADGDFADADEQVFANLALLDGMNHLSFPVPAGARPESATFARFRYSTAGGLSFVGPADDGEVEDYQVRIEPVPPMDFGDAPDGFIPGYPTLLMSNGARHALVQGGPLMGPALSTVDAEPDGQPRLGADGDDTNGVDDEDGVTFTTALVRGQLAEFKVDTSGSPVADALFNAWIDFNGDRDWNDLGEQVAVDWALPIGVTTVDYWVPWEAVAGPTYARFRISTQQGLSFDGMARDGEVEDYSVGIKEAWDFGDAPDSDLIPGYPTLLVNNGARHRISPNLSLGGMPDAEPDGQPTAAADGDDQWVGGNQWDDEDGVTFLNSLLPGSIAYVDVWANGSGKLDAWVDFNGNGSWADLGEQVFPSLALASGLNHLSFAVPASAKPDSITFARFRYSTAGGLSFSGPADDGEVEDYQVQIGRSKWAQPPEPAHPTNVYYGWNETSIHEGWQIAADDWVCTTPEPVSAVRWWGSFQGWRDTVPPSLPDYFHLAIWTDVPSNPENYFSHPGKVVWEEDCYRQSYSVQFVGWDYDPRSQTHEACFQFDQALPIENWFYQPAANQVYWMSIAAAYPTGETEHPFGWKTRPRDPSSPAPDRAVDVGSPTGAHVDDEWVYGWPVGRPPAAGAAAAGNQEWWEQEWDLAFELLTQPAKWRQVPDPRLPGVPAHDFIYMEPLTSYTSAADDWQCEGGQVRDLHWWGNYEMDSAGGLENRGSGIDHFQLSIHTDIPGPPYSKPGTPPVWSMDVPLSALTEVDTGLVNSEGSRIYLYQYDLPMPFEQVPGHIYWFDITAFSHDPHRPACWRWQEAARTATPRLDAAVDQFFAVHDWEPIQWPGDPPLYSELAYEVSSGDAPVDKWSQPPVRYDVPNAYNGWDAFSVYGQRQIVADDWKCTTAEPVTDVHWWGSFVGWGEPWAPQLPDAFHISIWTDVPQGPNEPFSHPGQVIWENYCTSYNAQFVGWDFDPRRPNAPPEATFYFSQDLAVQDWFWQGPGQHVYWVSIEAVYAAGQDVEYPFGWKTRPRDPESPAPDDAVIITAPTAPGLVDGSVFPVAGGTYVGANEVRMPEMDATISNVRMVPSAGKEPALLPPPGQTFHIDSFFDVFFDITVSGGPVMAGSFFDVYFDITVTDVDEGQFEMALVRMTGGDPAGIMIRESPTRASQGRTTMTANGVDNDCDSFFDIFIEVSTDGGQTWVPADGPLHLDLVPPNEFLAGRPIEYPEGVSWDMAFVLTTTRKVWDGGTDPPTSDGWTDNLNWSTDAAPVPGESLEFPADARQKEHQNDFPAGTAFGEIVFSGGGYHIGGQPLRLQGDITNALTAVGDNALDCEIKLDYAKIFRNNSPASTLAINGSVNTDGNTLTLDGPGAIDLGSATSVISGGGSLIKQGPGTTTLSGNNTYAGGTFVYGGTVLVATPGALPTGGSLDIGGGATVVLIPDLVSAATGGANLVVAASGEAMRAETAGTVPADDVQVVPALMESATITATNGVSGRLAPPRPARGLKPGLVAAALRALEPPLAPSAAESDLPAALVSAPAVRLGPVPAMVKAAAARGTAIRAVAESPLPTDVSWCWLSEMATRSKKKELPTPAAVDLVMATS